MAVIHLGLYGVRKKINILNMNSKRIKQFVNYKLDNIILIVFNIILDISYSLRFIWSKKKN